MSFSGSPRCYDSVVENDSNLRLSIKATNDDADSALGGCMHNIQRGNCVAMSSAAEVRDATRNQLFNRPISPTKIVKHKNNKADPKEGVFDQFAEEIQECLIVVGM